MQSFPSALLVLLCDLVSNRFSSLTVTIFLLSKVKLRLAAWFAPEAIPRGIFAADKALLSEALHP
jgi:hypothetical protein